MNTLPEGVIPVLIVGVDEEDHIHLLTTVDREDLLYLLEDCYEIISDRPEDDKFTLQ
jgi:hypothetical protein